MPRIKDRKLRLYGPLVLNIFLLLFFYSKYYQVPEKFLSCLLSSSFYSFLAWESSRFLSIVAGRMIPGIYRDNRWLRFVFFLALPVTLLITSVNHLFRLLIGFFTEFKLLDFLFIEGMTIIITAVIIGLYERIYFLRQWKRIQAEAENLRKINSNSQLKMLEDQLKPHFLFNSLNTLQSLIMLSPEKAEEFVEEMSSVYRYLLRKNRKELTTLNEEINFLESYILMIRTRFEESFSIEFDIRKDDRYKLLPPFVLQLLVENAIKHNILSKQQPLLVSVRSGNHHSIIVSNNLQRKNTKERSEKTGLTNLIERYKLLGEEHRLHIIEEEYQFKVIIPLLSSDIFSDVDV